jgi:amidase
LGPLARHIEDLILTLPLIAGADGRDPSVVPMPLGDPAAIDLNSLRVSFHTDNGIHPSAPGIADVVQRVASALAEAGLIVEERRPAVLGRLYETGSDLWMADGGAGVRRLLADAGTCEVSDLLQGFATLAGGESGQAGMTAAEADALLIELEQCRGEMLAFLDAYDLILCPVNASAALPHGTMWDEIPAFSYTATYSLTGWPAAVVRGGTSPEGLPIGVQIVARPWREDVALAVARHIEEIFGGWQPPPL